MKILYIWHAAIEKEYRKLLWEIAKKGHKVFLVIPHRWTESSRDQRFTRYPEDENITVIPLVVVFRNHIRSFFFINKFKIISILSKVKPDVIYIKEEPYSLASFQWVFLARLFSPNSTIVIESDENLAVSHPLPFKLTERYVLSKIHGIASVPTAGIDLYRNKNFKGLQFKTSYFVDTSIFHPISQKEAKKAFPEIKTNNLKIGFVGRVTEEKGIDTIIEAIHKLKKDKIEVKLYILGKADEKYRKYLEEIIEKLFVKENVIFLKPRPLNEIVFFYNVIDVLVLPSKTTPWWVEQFGRVIIEAHACGTPVIGSTSGEIPFVVNDKRMIFPENDPTELAKILEKFARGEYSKEKLKDSLIQNANRFSLEKIAEEKCEIMIKAKKYKENKD
ncbi:MAG: glycosyltransferase family 4 protein [Brevinematia bacterium]